MNPWLQILLTLAIGALAVLIINAVFDHLDAPRRNEILERAFGPDRTDEQ